jgi:hypothetical protein
MLAENVAGKMQGLASGMGWTVLGCVWGDGFVSMTAERGDRWECVRTNFTDGSAKKIAIDALRYAGLTDS